MFNYTHHIRTVESVTKQAAKKQRQGQRKEMRASNSPAQISGNLLPPANRDEKWHV